MRKGLLAVVAFWVFLVVLMLKPAWILIGMFVALLVCVSALLFSEVADL